MDLIPFSYFNLYADDKERSFCIGDRYITIKQFDDKGIGGKFWDCSILVMEYLKSHASEWAHRKVIEISAGCGLVSMTLSILNCNMVIATELPEILSANTAINVKHNEAKASFVNLRLMPLEWGNYEHLNAITIEYKDITNLIACECLYEEAPFDKLLLTLIELSKIYKGLSILFIYKKRYVYQEECLKVIEKHFNVTLIPREEYHYDFRDKEQYQIMTLKYKE